MSTDSINEWIKWFGKQCAIAYSLHGSQVITFGMWLISSTTRHQKWEIIKIPYHDILYHYNQYYHNEIYEQC